MVQKVLGRPKKFNRDVGLAAAIEVFWQKGYNGASLDDLTQAMGINRPSLYATYGNKEKLYLEALSEYGKIFGSAQLAAFESAKDPKSAVQAYFYEILKSQTRLGDCAQGCLMSSCAATTVEEVEGVSEILTNGAELLISTVEKRFDEFKNTKQLPSDFPSKAKAKLILDILQGFAYRSRIGIDCQILLDDIDEKVIQVIT